MSKPLQSTSAESINRSTEVGIADHPSRWDVLQQSSVICSLGQFGLLKVSGDDAASFLQGQLSNDVRLLNGSNAQYTGYSSAKGRLLASFLLWQFAGDYYLLLASDLAEVIARRLSMFILRSKVKLTVCEDWVLRGLNGPAAENWLAKMGHILPEKPLQLTSMAQDHQLLRLGNGALLSLSQAQSAPDWSSVAADGVVEVDPPCWSLLDIAAGIPWISLVLQEQFVAQMVNMDLIDAISFTKGCYPGQEIIARTRYLGKIKRRMLRIGIPAEVTSGAALYCQSMGDQPVGMVVNAAQDRPGFYQALAVIQMSLLEEAIYLGEDNSNKIEILSLPYSLADE